MDMTITEELAWRPMPHLICCSSALETICKTLFINTL